VGIAADASIVVAANFNGSVFCWRPRSGDEHEFVPLKRLNVSFGAERRGARHERACAQRLERIASVAALGGGSKQNQRHPLPSPKGGAD
jgi:hypothetical protein